MDQILTDEASEGNYPSQIDSGQLDPTSSAPFSPAVSHMTSAEKTDLDHGSTYYFSHHTPSVDSAGDMGQQEVTFQVDKDSTPDLKTKRKLFISSQSETRLFLM